MEQLLVQPRGNSQPGLTETDPRANTLNQYKTSVASQRYDVLCATMRVCRPPLPWG